MVSTKRISEAFRFYVYNEPGESEESINRYKTLRDRLGRILKSSKFRSIQLAMGSDGLPFQFIILKMSDKDFNEFIDDNITGKRRKELYIKYGEREI